MRAHSNPPNSNVMRVGDCRFPILWLKKEAHGGNLKLLNYFWDSYSHLSNTLTMTLHL